MSRLSKLLQVTEEEKTAILKHYKITEDEFEENVELLREWVNKSEHLPNEDHKNKYRVALLNAKMSLEKAKQSIEGYYRIRSRYSQEFFDKLVPNSKEYNEGKRLVTTVVLPKLTPNLCRITMFKMSDPNGEASDAYLYEILVLMMAEMRMQSDLFISNVIIMDFEDYSWKNLLKYTPVVNQKLVDILLTMNLRIESIHFVNMTNFIDHIMRLLKSLLPSKIVNKIHMHKTYESLMNEIPRECLPSDYGGTQKSINELYEEWCEQIEESEDIFQKLLGLKSSEKIDLDPNQTDMFGCGAEGTFKQLCLD